jgi:hypothetical protein
MKLIAATVLLAVLLSPAGAAPALTVTVANPLATARAAETITVPWAEVARALPGALLQHLAVRDAAGHSLAYQVTNVAPNARDPHNVGAGYGDLIFQHDFAAGEGAAAFTVEGTAAVAPVYPARVFARFVPERYDDFAWENDRIAHRTYGPALAAPDPGQTGKEVATESGLDVWSKKVDYLIVDRWYNKGGSHYHKDEGEGMDMFEVGKSRGCGGTGIWDGRTLATSGNFTAWKVIANGPIRAIFELNYAAWDAHGRRVAETKHFTVDAGHNLDELASTFTDVDGGTDPLTVAIGLTKDSADHDQEPQSQFAAMADEGSATVWEVEKTHGSIGTAVVVPGGSFAGVAEDPLNHLVLATAVPGRPLRYLVGAGWSKSGQFPTRESWQQYVAGWAARLRSPVRVTLTATP